MLSRNDQREMDDGHISWCHAIWWLAPPSCVRCAFNGEDQRNRFAEACRNLAYMREWNDASDLIVEVKFDEQKLGLEVLEVKDQSGSVVVVLTKSTASADSAKLIRWGLVSVQGQEVVGKGLREAKVLFAASARPLSLEFRAPRWAPTE